MSIKSRKLINSKYTVRSMCQLCVSSENYTADIKRAQISFLLKSKCIQQALVRRSLQLSMKSTDERQAEHQGVSAVVFGLLSTHLPMV